MRLRFIQRAAAFVTTGALLLSTSIPASAQQVRYYHLDAIGSVRAISNASGVVVERHDYLPFGEECTTGTCLQNPGLSVGGPRKFTGKERDTETGLDYFGARYYGSKIGRFTTVDPVLNTQAALTDPQRWNRYAYALNNPLRYLDPDGRDILVVEQGPTTGNPIGHTAMAVSGQGIYSFGNNTPPGSSPTEYLLRDAPNRDTTIFMLKTTPEQDAAALRYLQSFGGTEISPSDRVESPRLRRALEIGYAACVENCSTRTNAALDAAGVPPFDPPTLHPDMPSTPSGSPGTAGARAAGHGAVRMEIPKGSTVVPPSVKAFEPR